MRWSFKSSRKHGLVVNLPYSIDSLGQTAWLYSYLQCCVKELLARREYRRSLISHGLV
jgi:hypothetical protein